ncbi:hypothetical protein LguiB_034839 [Lonicera macranthoides]
MAESASAKRWLPLEANPDVMNQGKELLLKYKLFDRLKKVENLKFMVPGE